MASSLIDQNWSAYSPEDHQTWTRLYDRLAALLPGRAAPAFMGGLTALDLHAGGIPNFNELSEALEALTGWQVVGVPGLVPDAEFFALLADRKFPAGTFIRRPDQFDYIQEPDVFHDVFGHVPMLTDPVFANYMQAYGEGGLRSLRHCGLRNLAALYWYTVEFGLIETPEGLRIYGAGILSSPAETVFCLESPSPNRLRFDLERVMCTDYKIDDFQQTYFVISSYEDLFHATVDRDFAPLYARMRNRFLHGPEVVRACDQVIQQGTQTQQDL